jgi:Transmembrane secretion effector
LAFTAVWFLGRRMIHVRKRDGAWRWHLFQDTADAEHWYEAFTVRAGCTICTSADVAPRPTRSSSSAPADFSIRVPAARPPDDRLWAGDDHEVGD